MSSGRTMEGCTQCMKYMLFMSNLLILIGGIVVLAVGIWTVNDKTHFEELLGTDLYISSAYILIGTGVVVTIISFMGCFGAVKEIRCMLITYFLVLLVLFVVLLVAGILGYVFRARVEDTITTRMTASLAEYQENQLIRDAWDSAQTQMECCGVESAQDWNGHVSPLPNSCCPSSTAQGQCSAGSAYTIGCQQRVKMFAKDHAQVIGGVGIGIACLMLLGMAFSLALFKSIE